MADWNHVFTLYPYHRVLVSEARGCRVTDTDGKDYVDLASGQLSASLGHGHPRLTETVRRQAARAVNLGNRFLSDAAVDACSEIASVTQEGLDKVVICSTGSEANEMAVRMARAATGKHELVGIRRGYYGATHEMMSMSEYVGSIKGLGTRSPGQHKLPCPDCQRCPMGLAAHSCKAECVAMGAAQLEEDSTGAIAAILVEPVLGSAGILAPPPSFFKAVRALANKVGALLIADEAQTGLGRTGRWMGMEHAGVVPDITVLSKTLGAGFPVAAVATTKSIEERCIEAPLANMSSHSLDPFASAIAAEVVRVVRDEGLVERSAAMGRVFAEQLEAVADEFEFFGNVRHKGLMAGMDVVSPRTGELDPMMSLVLEAEGLHQGLIVGYSALSGVVRLLPPLTIDEATIEEAMKRLRASAIFLRDNPVDLTRYLPTHEGSMKLAMRFLAQIH